MARPNLRDQFNVELVTVSMVLYWEVHGMNKSRKPATHVATSEQRQPLKSAAKRFILSLGRTSQHLQGADGRYGDNDQLRSYYK